MMTQGMDFNQMGNNGFMYGQGMAMPMYQNQGEYYNPMGGNMGYQGNHYAMQMDPQSQHMYSMPQQNEGQNQVITIHLPSEGQDQNNREVQIQVVMKNDDTNTKISQATSLCDIGQVD